MELCNCLTKGKLVMIILYDSDTTTFCITIYVGPQQIKRERERPYTE